MGKNQLQEGAVHKFVKREKDDFKEKENLD